MPRRLLVTGIDLSPLLKELSGLLLILPLIIMVQPQLKPEKPQLSPTVSSYYLIFLQTKAGPIKRVPPSPGLQPPPYPGNRSGRGLPPLPPDPYRPQAYGGSPLPVQNNTFTGSYYRGSSVVYPKVVRERTLSRVRKEEVRRSQIEVEVVKDHSQRKVDASK
jgi:hypothetical protein